MIELELRSTRLEKVRVGTHSRCACHLDDTTHRHEPLAVGRIPHAHPGRPSRLLQGDSQSGRQSPLPPLSQS